MKTIQGPALFLAQFAGDEAPFNTWDGITKWAADCGYKGVQVPRGLMFILGRNGPLDWWKPRLMNWPNAGCRS